MSQILNQSLKKLDIEEIKTYNYFHFNAKEETKSEFMGPDIGEIAPDFVAYTINGDEIRLSDYKGKTVVIESGSYTCPSFIGYINPMNKLSLQYSDVEFLVLYVREAHPGSKIGPHQSMN
ncbi:MAG: peroxiredoxin family protein, partial [Candidatus Kariarchaeaceae archaeon]